MIQANVLQKRSQDTIICNKVIRYMCYVFEYSSDLYKPTFLRLSLSLSQNMLWCSNWLNGIDMDVNLMWVVVAFLSLK